jgi:phage tail-like protein
MANNTRPIQFLDYLPERFRSNTALPNEVDQVQFLSRFLQGFEDLFEELQAEIEGPTNLSSGGIPDLFNPATTPPPEFKHRPEPTTRFDYLNYLASWIGLPLRPEKPLEWNREFFKAAIALYPKRGTFLGLEAMLRAWLKGDLLETEPPLLILTDLTRSHTDVDTVFQLDVTATLGIDTILGEGLPFFFIVDLIVNPNVLELRTPEGVDNFQRAARFLLDTEKPFHTFYQLRIRSSTMQLVESGQTTINGQPAAQIGVTTLLWDEPLIFNSNT